MRLTSTEPSQHIIPKPISSVGGDAGRFPQVLHYLDPYCGHGPVFCPRTFSRLLAFHIICAIINLVQNGVRFGRRGLLYALPTEAMTALPFMPILLVE
jgi:hypothetical protein